MSSILSTQNRHIFLRRKYCFLPAIALSPPVGRWEPLIGLPPLNSAMFASYDYSFASAGAAGAGCSAGAVDAGSPGAAAAGSAGMAGAVGIEGAAICGAGLLAARFARAFFRFSIFLSFSSMRTVMNLIT